MPMSKYFSFFQVVKCYIKRLQTNCNASTCGNEVLDVWFLPITGTIFSTFISIIRARSSRYVLHCYTVDACTGKYW